MFWAIMLHERTLQHFQGAFPITMTILMFINEMKYILYSLLTSFLLNLHVTIFGNRELNISWYQCWMQDFLRGGLIYKW